MQVKYKQFTVKYQFVNSVWTNEKMTVTALTMDQAINKVRNEIAGAYGSDILKKVTFNQ